MVSLGDTLQEFIYSDSSPWPGGADGSGPSLEIVDPMGDPTNPANWRASLYDGGSPGDSGVQADYDGNNVVDTSDQLAWRGSFGLSVARGTAADGNRDGIVDAADYIVWRNNLAVPATSAAMATVVRLEQASPGELTETVAQGPAVDTEAIDLALAGSFLRRENVPPPSPRFIHNLPMPARTRVENALILAVHESGQAAAGSSANSNTNSVVSFRDHESPDTRELFTELDGDWLRWLRGHDWTNLDIAERDLAVVAL